MDRITSPGTLVGSNINDPMAQLTQTYQHIISKMLTHADNILDNIQTAKGNQQVLTRCIEALHSLTHSARQFGLPASVRFAVDRNDILALETVMKHPILGPILQYLDNTNINSSVYLDWTLTIYTEGFMKQKLVTKLDYTLTNNSPFMEDYNDVGIEKL
jgi:hypothetical protein